MAADTKKYQEAISKINSYVKKVKEDCGNLKAAAQDCVDNTQNDEHAKKCSASMNSAVSKIQEQLTQLQKIAKNLQQEIERIQKAGA